MAVDLRQVMVAILTFSIFVMLANRESEQASMTVCQNNSSMRGGHKLNEIDGPRQTSEAQKFCWAIPSFEGQRSKGNIANAVAVARHLGATLVLPDITATQLGQKRHFGEIYDAKKFIESLNGVVQVAKLKSGEVSSTKVSTVMVPQGVSELFIKSKVVPIYRTHSNLRLQTYFDSLASPNSTQAKHLNAYECSVTFKSLKLQAAVDSMVGTLKSMSPKMGGCFVAVDFKVDMLLGKKRCQEKDAASKHCYNAEEICEFLREIGFQKETTIYLTQTSWHSSIDALRNNLPNTFTKDAIMPADKRAKFTGSDCRDYEKFIDCSICTESDAFIPEYPGWFYARVTGKKIASGKTQVLVPSNKTSELASDYLSLYIATKSHFAHSCFC